MVLKDGGRMVKRITRSRARGEGVRRSLSDRGLSEEQGKVRARDRKEWRKFVNA